MYKSVLVNVNIGIAVGIVQTVDGQQAHILGMLVHHRELRRAAVRQGIRI